MQQKRNIRTEHWQRVCMMGLPASVQHLVSEHDQLVGSKLVTVFPFSFLAVVDLITISPLPVLRTALRQWADVSSTSIGCLTLNNSSLASARQWGPCSDSAPALIVFETRIQVGWRFAPMSHVPRGHKSSDRSKLCRYFQCLLSLEELEKKGLPELQWVGQ